MNSKIRMPEFPPPVPKSIIERIMDAALKMNLVRKNGVFYTDDGKYFGTIYDVAQSAYINMKNGY